MTKTYVTFEFSYNKGYDDPSLRGIDEPRPWNLSQEIIDTSSPNKTLLDIGCGSGLKLIDIAKHFFQITGLDPNIEMLQLAEKRFIENNITNFSFVVGSAKTLPFPDNSFDIATVMMAPHDAKEILRVLKPGGHVIIETLGEMDKRQLKDFFENDTKLRGQLSERPQGSSKILYQTDFSSLFDNLSITEGFWKTYYSKEGLLALLQSTPTVSKFNLESDNKAFEKAVFELPKKDDLIILTQHRLLIKGTKPLL
jgi:ubiquinone/menaquinone biosynthesis C-methylase UbiE